MAHINYEITDTYGGESNYSWVKRGEFESNKSNLSIVRRVKSELGYNGIRCKVVDFGDTIALYPYGKCIVIFINFEY